LTSFSLADSPTAIQMKFSTLVYNKAALVLRMIKDSIAEEVFIQGLKYYLDEMKFKSAAPEDLYRNLQKSYDEAHPENNVNIDQFMDTWTNFHGLPIVTVSRSASGLMLS
jgi:aminopeptidase N